jgi:hypothetical protein
MVSDLLVYIWYAKFDQLFDRIDSHACPLVVQTEHANVGLHVIAGTSPMHWKVLAPPDCGVASLLDTSQEVGNSVFLVCSYCS